MLAGEYRHGLDAKNRIFIPAKLREELGQTILVAKNIREKCLKVYSLTEWEKYIGPLQEQNRKLSEKLMRFIYPTLLQATPDSQGRIVLTGELIGHAEIDRNVVIVGCGKYAEIWSEELYDATMSDIDVDELVADLESLGY